MEDVELLRKSWIHELREGGCEKIQGMFKDYTVPNTYCAMGVAGKVIGEGFFTELCGLDRWGMLQDDYNLSDKIIEHVTAMNDGAANFVGPCHAQLVRKSGNPRDFNFIARWLEIVFVLSNMEEPV